MDWRHGFALMIITILLFPAMIQTMEIWDEAEREHDRNCNLLLNQGGINLQLCEELEADSSAKLARYTLVAFSFIICGVSGLVLLLPAGEDGYVPPPGLR